MSAGLRVLVLRGQRRQVGEHLLLAPALRHLEPAPKAQTRRQRGEQLLHALEPDAGEHLPDVVLGVGEVAQPRPYSARSFTCC
jgi:hypothetical protein